MNSIESTIKEALQQTYEHTRKLIEQNQKKLSRKQKDIGEFFAVPVEDCSSLFASTNTLGSIEFRNAMLCFERFVKEKGSVIREGNYSQYGEARIPSIRGRIETGEGLWTNILLTAVVFFEIGGQPYTAEISPQRFSDSVFTFAVTGREKALLDNLMEEFDAYCIQHHYLKGKKFNGVSGSILPLSSHKWEDLVWPEGMKERMQSEIEVVFRNAALFNAYGLNSKKGFILAGEPGNGKTLLLKILAKVIDATCILVPFDQFGLTPYLFSLARDLAPTILILEDIDLFGTDRDESSQSADLGKLMNQLDGIIENREIVVIATTNRLEKVEKALQNRPGRFDRIYEIPNPDFQMRINLISYFIERIPNEITREHIEVLAEGFAGYSAAYLKELVNSGFAQAILRDSQAPILRFRDMESMVDILKHRKDRTPVGFVVPESVRGRSSIQNKKEESL